MPFLVTFTFALLNCFKTMSKKLVTDDTLFGFMTFHLKTLAVRTPVQYHRTASGVLYAFVGHRLASDSPVCRVTKHMDPKKIGGFTQVLRRYREHARALFNVRTFWISCFTQSRPIGGLIVFQTFDLMSRRKLSAVDAIAHRDSLTHDLLRDDAQVIEAMRRLMITAQDGDGDALNQFVDV